MNSSLKKLTIFGFLSFIGFLSGCEWTAIYKMDRAPLRADQFDRLSTGGYASIGVGISPWVLRLTESGKVDWQKRLLSDKPSLLSIAHISENEVIVTGRIQPENSEYPDLFVAKIQDGGILWQYRYGGENDKYDGGYAITVTSDGGYMVAGMSQSFGSEYSSLWVIKLDDNGDIVWQKRYYLNVLEDLLITPKTLRATKDGNYLIAGLLKEGDGNQSLYTPRIWLLKIDPNGDVLFHKRYRPDFGDIPLYTSIVFGDIQETKDNGYIMATAVKHAGSPTRYSTTLSKLGSDGMRQWDRMFSLPHQSVHRPLLQTLQDGDYLIAGEVGDDLWLSRLDPLGTIQWQQLYNPYGKDGVTNITSLFLSTEHFPFVTTEHIVIAGSASIKDLKRPFILKASLDDGDLPSRCGLLDPPSVQQRSGLNFSLIIEGSSILSEDTNATKNETQITTTNEYYTEERCSILTNEIDVPRSSN